MRKRAKPSKEYRPLIAEILAHPEADPTEESTSKFLDAFVKAGANGNAQTRRRGPTSNRTTAAIVAEMKGLGIGTSDFPIVLSPIGSDIIAAIENIKIYRIPKEFEWTTGLKQYKQAHCSAVNALVRLTAETQALRCSFNAKSSRIEQALFSIRAGLMSENDPCIQQLIPYAQSIGEERTIHTRIAEAVRDASDAKRRNNDGTLLPDLNTFRLTLCLFWIGFLFWQMSDENITKFMSDHKLFPAAFKANRPTITEARNELGLKKGPQQVVKSVEPNFHWLFKEGYPQQ